MISTDVHDGILANCNMSDVGPLLGRRMRGAAGGSRSAAAPGGGAMGFVGLPGSADACDDLQNEAFAQFSGVNIYDIYVNVCPSGARAAKAASSASALSPLGDADSNVAAGCDSVYDPCADGAEAVYLNLPAVKAAIHANASITWQDCSDVVNYSREDLLTSMLPVYEYLLTNWPQGRYLVYSGDVDAIVPVTGTRAWLAALGLPAAASDGAWRQYTVSGQTGGWTQAFDGPNGSRLSFASVRNAGHFCPSLQRERSLYMITQFLNGAAL